MKLNLLTSNSLEQRSSGRATLSILSSESMSGVSGVAQSNDLLNLFLECSQFNWKYNRLNYTDRKVGSYHCIFIIICCNKIM